jgi:uncharacterized membrane protein YgdD (TMEM256/DUF423 family)
MAKMKPLRLAAVTMFVAVALGAFGAHGLAERLEAVGRVEVWKTAVLYQLAHGLALLALGVWQNVAPAVRERFWIRLAAPLWFWGTVAFSGSLYLVSLGAPSWLGPVTPLGGLAFLAGWLALAIGVWSLERKQPPPA